ncbi:MAG: NAD(P)H-quinone oxidoreductase [Steroidobacteraceae bacterium]
MSELPASIAVVEIVSPGGPEALQPARRPMPQPGADEVLIQVAAAGVNRPDVLQRQGQYPPPPGASDIPGLEVAGTVVRVGPRVKEWSPGDRVCALLAGGGYAEYAVAPAAQCLPVPGKLSLEEAAVLPETVFTVYYNVFERSGLRPGQWLLVHGGSSGIGVTAIVLGKAYGAAVIVTAGSAEKCAACRALGADVAINYKREDFVAATVSATAGKGADVILDMVGGEYVPRDIAAAASDGRIAIIATLGGRKTEIDLAQLMVKRLMIGGSTLRAQSVSSKGRIGAALRREIWPLIESKSLRLPIHATFPLAEAARAHALMESGTHIGKIALRI